MVEPLGVTVCRLSLDPVRGRIRHPRQVGIAVRAAMFSELAESGRLIGTRMPEAIGEIDTERPMLDAVHAAVASRRPTPWKRWFSHVEADRDAATKALLTSGRWQNDGKRIVDTDPSSTLVERQRVQELLTARVAPDDVTTAVLVLLLGGAGAVASPAPRRSRKLVKTWLVPQLAYSGLAGTTTVAAVSTALKAMRSSNPVPLLSR